jgi:uncharacterized surface protein with fasciclin (FAS1) repeats
MHLPSILEALRESGDLNEFVRLVEAAGMAPALRDRGPFTVFAPFDGAFGALPENLLVDPASKRDLLAHIVSWHIVVGELWSKEVPQMKNPTIKTLRGVELAVSRIEGEIFVNTARVVRADIGCSNGVIHIIDSVLMPLMVESIAWRSPAGRPQ